MRKHVIHIFLLMGLVATHAQSVEDFQNRLTEFYKTNFPVKVSISFHQPYYAPGDTAFFSLYFLNAQLIPISNQQIITIKLVEASGKISLSQQILVKQGWAQNQLIIPNEIEPGPYRVVAFNDWMRNFDRGLMCIETLLITGEKTFETRQSKTPLKAIAEGGNLVAGVSNRIIVQGEPNVRGAVMLDGQEVSAITTDNSGFGFFMLTPEFNQSYSVLLAGEKVSLPLPTYDAVALFLINSAERNQALRVGIQVSEQSTIRQAPVQLIMAHHDEVFYSSEVTVSKKTQLLVTVPKQNFPTGIAQLYIFQNGRVLAERSFFSNAYYSNVNVEISQKTVMARSDARLNLSITDENGAPMDARLTVKVFKKNLFIQTATTSMARQLLLNDDLTVDPTWLKNEWPNKQELSQLDMLLALYKWPRFNPVNKELNRSSLSFGSRDDIRISARLKDLTTNQPLPDSTLVSIYISKSNILNETFTDEQGGINGSLLQYFYGEEETYVRAERNGKRIYPIQIEVQADTMRFSATSRLSVTDQLDPYFAYNKVRHSVNASYTEYADRLVNVPAPNLHLEKMPIVDTEIDIDDYQLFPNMSETIKEIIPLLTHRNVKGKDEVRLYLSELSRTGTEAPIFFIDGVMTDDTDYFLKLNPFEVDKIKLIHNLKKLNFFGRIGQNGVVMVETKIPNNASRVPRSTAHYIWQGISKPVTYHAVLTPSANPRIPQLTPSLYWAPNISTQKGVIPFSIPTSDDLGTYVVIIEGITTHGEPIYYQTEFEVVGNIK
jgi:hypothetical protein